MLSSEKDVKEIILKAAQNVFSRYGFKKTTMDEIAESSHKAKSSIYHYFKSKDEIFQAIVEKESRTLIGKIKVAIEQENTYQEKLRAYFLTRMHAIDQVVNFYSAMKDEYLEQYGFIEKLRANHDKEEIKIMKEILKEGCERGIFEIRDLDITAITIITALKGLEYSWMKEKNVSKTEKDIDSLLEILFHGIVNR